MPTENERKDILEACCRKLELEEEVDLSYLANKTPNFSGADLQALVYNAHLDAVHEVLESRKAFDQDSEEEGLGSAVDMVTSAVANVASAATQSAINQRVCIKYQIEIVQLNPLFLSFQQS